MPFSQVDVQSVQRVCVCASLCSIMLGNVNRARSLHVRQQFQREKRREKKNRNQIENATKTNKQTAHTHTIRQPISCGTHRFGSENMLKCRLNGFRTGKT